MESVGRRFGRLRGMFWRRRRLQDLRRARATWGARVACGFGDGQFCVARDATVRGSGSKSGCDRPIKLDRRAVTGPAYESYFTRRCWRPRKAERRRQRPTECGQVGQAKGRRRSQRPVRANGRRTVVGRAQRQRGRRRPGPLFRSSFGSRWREPPKRVAPLFGTRSRGPADFREGQCLDYHRCVGRCVEHFDWWRQERAWAVQLRRRSRAELALSFGGWHDARECSLHLHRAIGGAGAIVRLCARVDWRARRSV